MHAEETRTHFRGLTKASSKHTKKGGQWEGLGSAIRVKLFFRRFLLSPPVRCLLSLRCRNKTHTYPPPLFLSIEEKRSTLVDYGRHD